MRRFEISDEQFQRIEPLLSGRAGQRGVTAADNRLFVEGVLWILRTGTPWRDLPAGYGIWSSVYKRYDRWCKKGLWKTVMDALKTEADAEAIALDSSVIRAHQHAAGAQKKRGSPTGPARRGWAGRGADSAPRSTWSSTRWETHCGSR